MAECRRCGENVDVVMTQVEQGQMPVVSVSIHQAQKPLGETSSTRHIVATGWLAFSRSTNR